MDTLNGTVTQEQPKEGISNESKELNVLTKEISQDQTEIPEVLTINPDHQKQESIENKRDEKDLNQDKLSSEQKRYKILLRKKELELAPTKRKRKHVAWLYGIIALRALLITLIAVLSTAVVGLPLLWSGIFGAILYLIQGINLIPGLIPLVSTKLEKKRLIAQIEEIKNLSKLMEQQKNNVGDAKEEKINRLKILQKKNYINLMDQGKKRANIVTQIGVTVGIGILAFASPILALIIVSMYMLSNNPALELVQFDDIGDFEDARNARKITKNLQTVLKQKLEEAKAGDENIEDLSKLENIVERISRGEIINDSEFDELLETTQRIRK